MGSPLEFKMEKLRPTYEDTIKNEIFLGDTHPFELLFKKESSFLILNITIGTPSQPFRVIYDTTSDITWVGSNYIKGCKSGCKNKFNKINSQTFKNEYIPWEKEFRLGDIKGERVNDIVNVENVSVKNFSMTWLLADEILFDLKMSDGIIGFGKNYSSTNKEETSFIHYLYSQNLINKKVFSSKFTDDLKTKASLYIGDYHSDFNKSNNYTISDCPIINNNNDETSNYWSCELTHIVFGNITDQKNYYKINSTLSSAIIDSGIALIYAPWQMTIVFDTYFEMVDGCFSTFFAKDFRTEYYCKKSFDLNLLPDISFVFNKNALTIPVKLLFREYDESKNSFSIQTSGDSFWTFGEALMKHFHIAFDYQLGKILFAGIDNIQNVISYIPEQENHIIPYLTNNLTDSILTAPRFHPFTPPHIVPPMPHFDPIRPHFDPIRPHFDPIGPDYNPLRPHPIRPNYDPIYDPIIHDNDAPRPPYDPIRPDYDPIIPDNDPPRPHYDPIIPHNNPIIPDNDTTIPDYDSTRHRIPSFNNSYNPGGNEESSSSDDNIVVYYYLGFLGLFCFLLVLVYACVKCANKNSRRESEPVNTERTNLI